MTRDQLIKNLRERFEATYSADGEDFGLRGYAETYRYRLQDIGEDELLEILEALQKEA